MRKNTLASTLRAAGIALGLMVTFAICYVVSAYFWVQNGRVVTFGDNEIQTTFWNLFPNWLITGEAGNALATGFGLVAVGTTLLIVLYAMSAKGVRALRRRIDKPVAVRK